MQKVNKIKNIVMIFCMIQMVIVLFSSNFVYAGDDDSDQGIFDKITTQAHDWDKLKKDSGKESVMKQSEDEVDKVTDDIYGAVRYIGGAIFIVSIAVTIISINMKDRTGKDIAGLKTTLAFTIILAILFLFAKPIINFFIEFFNDFENTL